MTKFRSVETLKDLASFPSRIVRGMQQKDVMSELGAAMAEDIRVRTRATYGASSDGGKREKLAPLAPLTIAIRKKFSDLSPKTKPRKSNLTMTGQMLDDLTHKAGRDNVRVLFRTERSSRVASYAHTSTKRRPRRSFMFLTRTEMRKAKRLLEDHRDELIRQYLLRVR